MKKIFIIYVLLLFCTTNCKSSIRLQNRFINQEQISDSSNLKIQNDYFEKGLLKPVEFNDDENIKTITLKKLGTAFSNPFLDLSKEDKTNTDKSFVKCCKIYEGRRGMSFCPDY